MANLTTSADVDAMMAAASNAAIRTAIGSEIGVDVQAYSAVLAATTASFLTADETKLDAIEAGADVTDAANVTAAGALMDSELTSIADVKALNQSVVSGATPTFTGTNISGTAASLTVGATTGVEAGADVTDATNVTAAGALMDSEVTNLAQVKAFSSADYATAAQGTTADAALPKTGGAMTGAITTNSTFDGRDVATDGTKLDGIEALADVTDATNVGAALTLTGDVTSSASMATTIAVDAVDIAMLSATGTASGTTFLRGDNTWATPAAGGAVDSVNTQTGVVVLDADDISDAATTNKFATAAELSAISANTAKTTNATHTGDVTGDVALTVASVAVTGQTLVTAVGTDHVLIADASDSGALKKALISDFASAGGDMAASTYDPNTVAEQLAGLTATQTLTNKTLNTAANTITVVAADVSDFDTEVGNNSAVTANTAKLTANTTNVTASGALMDSEVTNLAQVKAFSSADYATSTQGATADSALQSGDNISVLTNNSGYLTAESDTLDSVTGRGATTTNGVTVGSIDINGEIIEKAVNTTSVTGSTALDPANGTIQRLTFSGAVTFTDSLVDGESITLHIDDGTAHAATWPTTEWVGGSAPTLDTTNETIVVVWKVNSTLYGMTPGVAS